MPVPSTLASFLWMQHRRDATAFLAKYPGAWLVWEPGSWAPPPRGGSTMTFASKEGAKAPAGADALCFHLGLATTSLTVGREPKNDLVINDGTVSRTHVTLVAHDTRWEVQLQAGRSATLNGVMLPATPTPLAPGDGLRLGGVTLTFHDLTSFLARISR